jgi:Xaa-Pro aminopeptidase
VSEPLEPGMVTSVEPGYYEPGWGGIRLENLYVVKNLSAAADSSEPQKVTWYGFESLTYIPFERKLIDFNRLDDRQRQWLEAYNRAIVTKLAPTLAIEEADWLKEICSL